MQQILLLFLPKSSLSSVPSFQATCFGVSTGAASAVAAFAASSVVTGGEADEEGTICMTAGVTVSVLVVLAISGACSGLCFKPFCPEFLVLPAGQTRTEKQRGSKNVQEPT